MDKTQTFMIPAGIFLLVFLAVPRAAPCFEEMIGAKAVAMGGSYRAVADDYGAVLLNPAGITQFPRYSIVAAYNYTSPSGADLLASSIVDSKTSSLGAGIIYIYRNENSMRKSEQELAFAVAQEYMKSFHIGFTTHYLWREDQEDGWRVDAATLISPIPYISVGVIGKNLVRVEDDQREIDFGFASRIHMLTVAFDIIWVPEDEESPLGYHLGGEIIVRGEIGLRGGYAFKRAGQDWYGLGLSWYVPRGSLSYAFRRGVGSSDEIGHWIEIGLLI